MIKNNFGWVFFVTIVTSFLSVAHSYTYSKTQYGNEIKWKSRKLTNYINSSSNSGLTQNEFMIIYQEALAQWNVNDFGFEITSQIGSPGSVEIANSIYFDQASSYFNGSGVIAVTQTAYRESTGEIIEADIIINDGIIFSGNPGDKMYLGNVLSHEFGHFFGLSHSEVKDATMFYSLGKNQWSIERDDISGIRQKYDLSDSYGTIVGKIVGGDSLVGIFGAHVSAISSTDGSVIAAVSAPDGSFSIGGLSRFETYYLSITPLKSLSTLPDYYSTAEKNFCLFGEDYTTSFFQPCEGRRKGFPSPISLTAGTASVGNITISCSLDAPISYLSEERLALSENGAEKRGSFIGYIIAEGKEDIIEINLSNYVPSGNNEYLSINLVSQGLFSPVILNVEVYLNGSKIAEYEGENGDYDLDISGKIAIGAESPGEYEIRVTTEHFIEFGDIYNSGFTSSDYFPEGATYTDNSHYYIFTYEIVSYSNGQYATVGTVADAVDNSLCPSAANTYHVDANVTVVSIEEEEGEAGISCATVVPESGGPGSGLSIIVGFILAFFAFQLLGRDVWEKKPLE